MSPTPEASEKQRKAAFKAGETIRRKRAEGSTSEATLEDKIRPRSSSSKTGIRKKWSATNYPVDWTTIRAEIRSRSRNEEGKEQCQCRGECLKHRGRCEEINGTWTKHRRSKGKVKIRLTIAHLCRTPKCEDKSHLRAMCEPCHLIYDLRCRQRRLRGEDAVEWANTRSSGPYIL